MRQASREQQSGAAIVAHLRKRRTEIEQATIARVHAVSVLPRAAGPEYAEGLRAAVSAGVEYGIEGIECGEKRAPPVPEALLSQARLAARSGVSLDTVLRRYVAGHSLLEDFLIDEAEREKLLGPTALKRLLRSQAAIVDRLLAAVSKAYTEEAERRPASAEWQKTERIERLLDGEPLDTSDLTYDFQAHHVGVVASGQEAAEALTELASSVDARLLTVRREKGVVWAWLGARRRLDPGAIKGFANGLPVGLSLAVGEPGEGVTGWRLTHLQARAAFPIAQRIGERLLRYADVALLASILHDDLLAGSLRQLYLDPLEQARDGGKSARETLVAYFATGHNVSSAAAVLDVDRRTVSNRIRAIEESIGRPLSDCAVELQMALRLEELVRQSGKQRGLFLPT
jgi:PucR C-terminal helix-turn-helix domain